MNVSSYMHVCALTGSQDECALDYVLWADECICTYLRMDPCPTCAGGLWYWRGSTVVSITHLQLLPSTCLLDLKSMTSLQYGSL